MRARNIKPGFFKNELLGIEDPYVSLTFIGLWCIADREGILEDRPLRIKAEIFPYREKLDINRYLTVLSRLDFIQRYKVNGVGYIKIANFKKHQLVHHTEKASVFPKPSMSQTQENKEDTTNNGYLTVNLPLNNGGNPSDNLNTDNLNTDNLNTDNLNTDIPEQSLAFLWNAICVSLPKVKEFSKERKRKEKIRLAERTIEMWEEVFNKINDSEFLKGNNNSGWKATYDWIINNSDNSIKVLEGKYNGQTGRGQQSLENQTTAVPGKYSNIPVEVVEQ